MHRFLKKAASLLRKPLNAMVYVATLCFVYAAPDVVTSTASVGRRRHGPAIYGGRDEGH